MIRPFGDAALLVELESAERAQSLAASLRKDPAPGMVEAVPGLASVLVEFDPLRADERALSVALEARLDAIPSTTPGGRLHTIPVVYDGPDMDDVAASTGLSRASVVAAHTEVELRVRFCGFAPGFAYLGDVPERLRVGRLATPRTATPAGSVAIAGRMSAIYPALLPGGWPVIGNADVDLFDPTAEAPSLLVPGDRVRFVPA
ncbi:MAG: 5-oxoprolinase subunit PxpB [Candidatus Limnocylindria bacterium]